MYWTPSYCWYHSSITIHLKYIEKLLIDRIISVLTLHTVISIPQQKGKPHTDDGCASCCLAKCTWATAAGYFCAELRHYKALGALLGDNIRDSYDPGFGNITFWHSNLYHLKVAPFLFRYLECKSAFTPNSSLMIDSERLQIHEFKILLGHSHFTDTWRRQCSHSWEHGVCFQDSSVSLFL